MLTLAGFAPLGCAIAYSAYVFPDTLVSTTFHDYYLTLAVLNTIVSIWLSCYSRYPAALPQGAWGEGWVAVEHGAPRTVGGDRGRGAGEPAAQFPTDFQELGGTSFAGTRSVLVLRAP